MKIPQKICMLIFVSFFCITAEAKIIRIEITKTESYKEGMSFGNIGEYEKLYGYAYGEVDPNDPDNAIIQDIELAPLNERGCVEYKSDIIILKPVDMDHANGVLFFSIPNRGNAFPVDDHLLNRGYVVLWAAWQGDVLPGNNRVTLEVPVATDQGNEITGRHRVEFQVRKPVNTLNLGFGYFNGNSHISYETATLDNATAVLTKRVLEADPKIPVPNSEWAFSDCMDADYPGKPSTTQISLKEGFQTQYIYELIYTAKNPLVLGLGLAASRDIASFLKYETSDEAGNRNPLITTGKENPVKAVIMQGISQSGLYVRTFLQLGFNKDENNRIVCDGVNPHIAPRRVSLNVRFARPGGGAGQRTDHLFPSFEPPFTWGISYDPVSGITGGILERCMATNTCPKVLQTFSSSEYWQLRASQRTTDALGKTDIDIHDQVRIYLFAGTQHTPGGYPDPVSGFTTNPNEYRNAHIALVIALEKWILEGVEPPPSKYPTLAEGTLVLPDKESIGWPDIPGVPYSGLVNKGSLIDFGPGFNIKDVSGILQEPPSEYKDKAYPILVPKVNRDGNETGGIQNINMRVPLGTYTGWSLRIKPYGEGDMNSLTGMFIPFANTKAERLASGDPRLSLEERYGSHENYVNRVKEAAAELVKEGFLLPEDAQKEIEKADKSDVLRF